MKLITLTLLLLSLSFSAHAEKTDALQDKVGKCASEILFAQFIPKNGNTYYNSSNLSHVEYASTADSNKQERQVVVAVNWYAYATSKGKAMTDEGNVEYYDQEKLNLADKIFHNISDSTVMMEYSKYHAVGSKSYASGGQFTLPTGVPYLTATQVNEQKCAIDQWGRKNCDDLKFHYTNFKVVIPHTFKSKMKWINTATKLETAFEVDLSKYAACLNKIK